MWPQIQATTSNWSSGAKKLIFSFFPYLLDPLISRWVPGAVGGHFWEMKIKNPSKPVPKNLLRCPELKKSLMHAYLAIYIGGANIAPPPPLPRMPQEPFQRLLILLQLFLEVMRIKDMVTLMMI